MYPLEGTHELAQIRAKLHVCTCLVCLLLCVTSLLSCSVQGLKAIILVAPAIIASLDFLKLHKGRSGSASQDGEALETTFAGSDFR